MIVVLLIPIGLWAIVPRRWHAWLVVLFVVLAGIVLFRMLRRPVRSLFSTGAPPGRSDWRWRRGWSVETYGRALQHYMRQRGWQVTSAEVIGADRLRIAGVVARRHVLLLFVRPGQEPDQADGERLDGADIALLVSDPAGKAVFANRIDYAAIQDLDEMLARLARARI